MQILVDTGVLLRAFDRGSAHQQTILLAFRRLRADGHELVTAAQNIAEFWNVSTRPTQARGGYGLSVAIVERRVVLLEKLFVILPFSDRAYQEWRRIVVTHQIMGVAVHDARLVATMTSAGITRLLTLNEVDFRRFSGLVVLTPDGVTRAAPLPPPGP